jgi:hypothetical protein
MLDTNADNLTELLTYYEQLVPRVFQKNAFPVGFELKPLDWALSDEIIGRPPVEIELDGKPTMIRPIGTMDVEFLSNEMVAQARAGAVDLVENYPCGLKCPGCFSEEAIYGDRANLMTWQEMMDRIDEARAIGLHSVKFLGPGELFQNPDLFDILDATQQRHLPISIFTKGAELGDDELTRKNFGHIGIDSAAGLVERVAGYENVRILLGFNSFVPKRQNKMVGSYNASANYQLEGGAFVKRGVADYTNKRNQALVNLTRAGFNDPSRGQRLSLIAAPLALDQLDEIPLMYVWAAMRNIPLVIAPTMESGPKSIGLSKSNMRKDPEHERLIEIFVAVYESALEQGILTLTQIEADGVSAYLGTSACNQVANGLFLRLNGRVQMCPGRSDESAVYGTTHRASLAQLWLQSPNYAMGRCGTIGARPRPPDCRKASNRRSSGGSTRVRPHPRSGFPP